ncbi:MAG: C69 family dipeptidase [Eggerthellaceae bacterium]|nr:C69 family dipeptidase [Eggerthellaceae bacterium]
MNSKKVSMSATATLKTNDKLAELDPFVKQGLSEAIMTYVAVPYVNSAREGAQRLGELIAEYGICSSEGCVIADENEVWYFETYTCCQ